MIKMELRIGDRVRVVDGRTHEVLGSGRVLVLPFRPFPYLPTIDEVGISALKGRELISNAIHVHVDGRERLVCYVPVAWIEFDNNIIPPVASQPAERNENGEDKLLGGSK